MKQDKVRLSEGQLKRQVDDYLTIQENMGNLVHLRLNSGSLLVKKGNMCHKVQLCPEGTADYLVVKEDSYDGNAKLRYARPIFIELKGYKGVQSEAQKEFQGKIEAQHGEYYIVRDLEELQKVLNG